MIFNHLRNGRQRIPITAARPSFVSIVWLCVMSASSYSVSAWISRQSHTTASSVMFTQPPPTRRYKNDDILLLLFQQIVRSRKREKRHDSRTSTSLSCQLLGMNCALPTEFTLSWPSFCARGGKTDIHADGWGLAYYQGHGLRQFHDIEAASTSPLAHFLGQQSGLQTRNFLAHIRYATSGSSTDLANVHPFSREMWGIQWCFCHNGQVTLYDDNRYHRLTGKLKSNKNDRDENCSVDAENSEDCEYVDCTDSYNGIDLDSIGNSSAQSSSGVNGNTDYDNYNRDEIDITTFEPVYLPIGDTDSEAVFCAILNALRARFTDTMPSLPVLYDYLQILCQEIVEYDPKGTIFNFLLTGGPHVLWVYSWPGRRPGSETWNGLHYIVRDSSTKVGDDDYTLDISIPESAANATELNGSFAKNNNVQKNKKTKRRKYKGDDSSVCIVATAPLTSDEEWIELAPGELIVMDNGRPHVSPQDLFRIELQGHGLGGRKEVLARPQLEEDMRRYQFDPAFFAADGI